MSQCLAYRDSHGRAAAGRRRRDVGAHFRHQQTGCGIAQLDRDGRLLIRQSAVDPRENIARVGQIRRILRLARLGPNRENQRTAVVGRVAGQAESAGTQVDDADKDSVGSSRGAVVAIRIHIDLRENHGAAGVGSAGVNPAGRRKFGGVEGGGPFAGGAAMADHFNRQLRFGRAAQDRRGIGDRRIQREQDFPVVEGTRLNGRSRSWPTGCKPCTKK